MSLRNNIVYQHDQASFNKLCLEVFSFQHENNTVYRSYCEALKIDVTAIDDLVKIPFLPIRFFRSHEIIVDFETPDLIFTSSGTTGSIRSKHFVADSSLYRESYLKGFELAYGNLDSWTILALLPSYQEGSSLIHMVTGLMKESGSSDSGFFLKNHQSLLDKILELQKKGHKIMLIGVSFALLEFSKHPFFDDFTGFENTVIMETGGMKGRGKELIRSELHGKLTSRFGVEKIHSEYGMTELLSQAYSSGDGKYICPPWMDIFIRDVNDPFSLVEEDKVGGVNVIDLANLYSCSFIATDDLGKKDSNGQAEILGRFDSSDVRGCNQMV